MIRTDWRCARALAEVQQDAAIAVAVEEQALATREITARVQVVTVNTSIVADAMQGVLVIVEGTDATSLTVLNASEEVGRTAETLRLKVADFLSAVSHRDYSDRQGEERILVAARG